MLGYAKHFYPRHWLCGLHMWGGRVEVMCSRDQNCWHSTTGINVPPKTPFSTNRPVEHGIQSAKKLTNFCFVVPIGLTEFGNPIG
ncbi:hypothetical protein Tcan_05769 [Toxocara canis]|uniref:Uncharacterized protein n=1 Tax=Toxocara canis TaxID=6265 RepID=A0A0B2VYU8_TOXCA|nr:hypothetical protein Tcan_05769 [Toxocara canis]